MMKPPPASMDYGTDPRAMPLRRKVIPADNALIKMLLEWLQSNGTVDQLEAIIRQLSLKTLKPFPDLWQREYDRRTLLRPCPYVASRTPARELLRAVRGINELD